MRQILTLDHNFKMLFGSMENIELLTSFLSCILEIPYKELEGNITFAKQELKEEIHVVRQTVDVLVNLPSKIIHIEMNPVYYHWSKRRNFIYGARIYENQFTSGDDYKKEINYIQINLNGYKQTKTKKVQEVYKMMSSDGKEWVKDFEIREINIPNCKKMWYDGDRREEVLWPSIFGCDSKVEFSKIIGESIMEEKTKEKLEKVVDNITKDQQVWWDYEKDEQMIINSLKSDAKEEGHAEGLAEGLAEGRTEGIKENQVDTARKMKAKGLTLSLISEITSLSIEEIEQL